MYNVSSGIAFEGNGFVAGSSLIIRVTYFPALHRLRIQLYKSLKIMVRDHN